MKYILLLLIIGLSMYIDVRYGKIPNALIAAGIITGVSINIYSSGITGLLYSAIGFLLGIMLLILPFALGGIGGGDVKLLGVIGVIEGSRLVFYIFLSSAIWGGIISAILLVYHKQFPILLKWTGNLFKQLYWFLCTDGKHSLNVDPLPSTNLSMPYTVPIFLGTVTILLAGTAL